MILTKEQIANKLIQEYEYQEKQVVDVVEKLFNMDPALQDAFDEWVVTGNIPEHPTYKGFNPKNAALTYDLKLPAIFLLLDWIRREPEEALKALYQDFHSTIPKKSKV
jgi:hypothetical protein